MIRNGNERNSIIREGQEGDLIRVGGKEWVSPMKWHLRRTWSKPSKKWEQECFWWRRMPSYHLLLVVEELTGIPQSLIRETEPILGEGNWITCCQCCLKAEREIFWPRSSFFPSIFSKCLLLTKPCW